MNIGFVSTWLERGATYVTRTYMDLLKQSNNLFVFARGGEFFDSTMSYEGATIEKGLRLKNVEINWRQFENWIKSNKLDIIIFNEQDELDAVYKTRISFPNVLLVCYIDYYKENTLQSFDIYDVLLCNTKRHYEAFKWHNGARYLPWGADLDVFKCPTDRVDKDKVVFFHSAGMSNRKGTLTLINAFVGNVLAEKGAKLIVHSQKKLETQYTDQELKKAGVEVITKTVHHPGLYYMGDVYVYPTTLDGLGLTIYEALASGLPVITTDAAPMNEIVNNENGRLVAVKRVCSRSDGYYWPLSYVDDRSLMDAMLYYIKNKESLGKLKQAARTYAEENLDIRSRCTQLMDILNDALTRKDSADAERMLREYKKQRNNVKFRELAESALPDVIKSHIRERFENSRKQ